MKQWKKLLPIAAIVAGLGLLAAPVTNPASAAPNVCDGLDSGKIDTTGDPQTVTMTAPAGNVITGYCIKAGSDQSVPGGAVRYIIVDPPVGSITVGHPSGKAVSHFSFTYEPVPPPTTAPPTTAPPDRPRRPTTAPPTTAPPTTAPPDHGSADDRAAHDCTADHCSRPQRPHRRRSPQRQHHRQRHRPPRHRPRRRLTPRPRRPRHPTPQSP